MLRLRHRTAVCDNCGIALPAFEELVRRRERSLGGLLRQLCGNVALADDLAQQSLLQAWSRLTTLRAPAALGAWLRQIAVDTWLAHLRHSPRLQQLRRSLPEAATGSPLGTVNSPVLRGANRLRARLSEAGQEAP